MKSKEEINVSIEWLTNTLKGYLDDTTEWRCKALSLEKEVSELRQMRENIIKALASIHEEDKHGNVKPYKYDAVIADIRAAVNPNTDSGWTYKKPWNDSEIRRDLDNLRIVK